MNHYDYIIIGGGCAGLSLAYHLNKSQLRDKKVLIIDREQKNKNDRTWCFWASAPTLFDSIIYRSWKKIEFLSDNFTLNAPLKNFSYNMIRGIDFYNEVQNTLADRENVQLIQDEFISVEEHEGKVIVKTKNSTYTADWAFDSTFDPKQFSAEGVDYHYLMQHFKGWIVATEVPAFDQTQIRMFDFRTEQGNEVRFFYILPFSKTEALVEYTLFSKSLIPKEEYEEKLKDYFANTLKISNYQIKETEFGIIPMTDFPLKQAQSKRIVNIGIRSGRAKPSTGYAFYRIQQDSENIVRSLIHSGSPIYQEKNLAQFKIYDAMILNIMNRKGGSIKMIFTHLFRKNPIERVLSFLNEQTSLWEDFLIMQSVPPLPFLIAIKNIFLSKKLIK
jgi:lycopene beta-cyclase